MTLTIVGLGPGPVDMLTLNAQQRLFSAREIYLQTVRHPVIDHLPSRTALHSFDDLYKSSPSLEVLADAIAIQLTELARRPQGVLYAVPGNPLLDDATVPHLLRQCKEEEVEVEIVAGVSIVEAAADVLALDQNTQFLYGQRAQLQIVDAVQLHVDPARPALVTPLYSQGLAVHLKEKLLYLYHPEHQVTLVTFKEGDGSWSSQHVTLAQIDNVQTYDYCTCLYLPPLSLEQNVATFNGLAAIVAYLRSPDGCPWDREQTHESLKPYLIEEAYETLEALDGNNMKMLQEELGDLLLNILIHCQIASEAGDFELRNVVRGIAEKLVRRHPHVFGDLELTTAGQVMDNWEILKSKERPERKSMLEGVPSSLPALAYTRSLQERIGPLKLSMVPGEESRRKRPTNEKRRSSGFSLEELGNKLFDLAFQSSAAGQDPEEALRLANARLRRRVQRLEELAWERGKSLAGLGGDEKAELWGETEGPS